MMNNNFNSYNSNNIFKRASQILGSGNIAGMHTNPSQVAGINKNPDTVNGINKLHGNVAGIVSMNNVVKDNTGPAKQVMGSDGRNMLKDDVNNNYNNY